MVAAVACVLSGLTVVANVDIVGTVLELKVSVEFKVDIDDNETGIVVDSTDVVQLVDVVEVILQSWSSYHVGLRSSKRVLFKHDPDTKGRSCRKSRMSQAKLQSSHLIGSNSIFN